MFCRLTSEYIKDGVTQIENAFLLRYLPSADPIDLKVYLYGLTLASIKEQSENSLERIALALKLTEERVMAAFKEWELQGLVLVPDSMPVSVIYQSVKNPVSHKIKYNAKELSVFSEEVTRLFPDKFKSQNDYLAYFDLIQQKKIEVNALLLIIKYCITLKKSSTPYILAVADSWIRMGLLSEQQVNEHISKLEANSEEVRMVLGEIGIKRAGDIEDKQYIDKWKADGFSLQAILAAARGVRKKSGLAALDKLIGELKTAGAVSAVEVAQYIKERDGIRELSINIVKALGGFYANIDTVAESYVNPWKAKGFTDGAMLAVAKFCFLRSYTTLDGMNQMLMRFYKLGLLDEDIIFAYIDKQAAIDEKLGEVFKKCVHTGLITNRDRDFYRVWADEWGFSDECILAAASFSERVPYPVQKINRDLSLCYTAKAFSVAEIKKLLEKDKPAASASARNEKRSYTDEQLKRIIVNMEDLEI